MDISHTQFAVVLYAAVFVAAFGLYRFEPSLALVALFVTEPFAFAQRVHATTITLPKVVLVAISVGVALDIVCGRFHFRPSSSRWIFAACAALVVATGMSIAQAANIGDATRETFKSTEYALLIFVAWYLANRAGAKKLAMTLPLLVLAVCTTALFDFWIGPKSVVVVDGVTIPRVAGVLEGPNQLGGWIALLFPFLLVYAATAERIRHRRIATLAVFLGVFTAVLTYSRAGLFSIAAEWICVLAFVPSRSHARVASIILAAAVGALFITSQYTPGALAYLTSTSQGSNTGNVATRPVLWAAAVELWQRHPLLGLGAGNFEDSLPLVRIRDVKTHSNNVYLQAVVEGGLPLLCATLALIFAPLFLLRPFVRRNAALAATFAAVCGFAIHGLVDDLWFFPKVTTMWCLFIGIAAASIDALRPKRLTISLEPTTFVSTRLRVPHVVPELEPALAAHDGTLG